MKNELTETPDSSYSPHQSGGLEKRISKPMELSHARCPICGQPPGSHATSCKLCETPHHTDCWNYFGGCARYGCRPEGYISLIERCTGAIDLRIHEFPIDKRPIDRTGIVYNLKGAGRAMAMGVLCLVPSTALIITETFPSRLKRWIYGKIGLDGESAAHNADFGKACYGIAGGILAIGGILPVTAGLASAALLLHGLNKILVEEGVIRKYCLHIGEPKIHIGESKNTPALPDLK